MPGQQGLHDMAKHVLCPIHSRMPPASIRNTGETAVHAVKANMCSGGGLPGQGGGCMALMT
eukprot:879027-Pelagomonas_calceolata.AAC.3